jgi:hypothetical protein
MLASAYWHWLVLSLLPADLIALYWEASEAEE